MSIYEKLLAVQAELKAPKAQRNAFGNYNYRSCEDILEAVKPLLDKHGATVVIGDTIELIGTRFYVKATARFIDVTDGTTIENTAFAREDDTKKGMDAPQITGTASSYARKYCLNGLFAIDDTKDADTDEYHNQSNKPEQKQSAKTEVKQSSNSEQKPNSRAAQKQNDKAEVKQNSKPEQKQFVKIEGNETFVLTKKGWQKPAELSLTTLKQMLQSDLYRDAHFVVQLAVNDKEAQQCQK